MTRILASLALFSLAACGAPSAPAAPVPEAAPVAQVSAPATSAGSLAAEALYGRWGDSGDCKKDIVFNPDGTFRSYTGGVGNWSLSGDTLTMSGAGGVFTLNVRALDANTIEINNPDGSVITSNRC